MTAVRVSPSTAAISCAGSQMLAGIRTARNGVFAMRLGVRSCGIAGNGGFGAGNPSSEESGFHVAAVGHDHGATGGGVGVKEFDGIVKAQVAFEDGGLSANCYAHGLCDVHFVLPCRCVYTVLHGVYRQRNSKTKQMKGAA